jgi:glycosyltransferase involved in cell wall biosynthesis
MADDRPDLRILIMLSTQASEGIGGTRRHVINLYDALKLREIRALVIYNDKDDFYSLFQDEGKEIRHVPFPRPHVSTRWHRSQRKSVREEIGRIVEEANISVIHLQDAYMSDYIDRNWGRPVYCAQIAGVQNPKRMGWWNTSLLLRLHPFRLAQSWYRKHVMYNYDRTDLVVNLSHAAQEMSEIVYGVPKSKNVVVPQGTQPVSPEADGRKIRSELNISDDTKLVISVGRITKAKGAEEFGEIAKHLSQKNDKVRFCFVGHDQGNPSYANEIIARYGEWVDFLGNREDLPDIYAAADLMIHPSHREAGPYVVVEAMAYGIPSVTWDIPGPNVIIQHDVNGLLIPFGDLDGITGAVRKCLEDETLYSRLSKGSLLRYSDYSLETYADNMIDVYDRLIAGIGTRPQ